MTKLTTLALALSLLVTAACSSMDVSARDQCVTVDRALSDISSINGTDVAVCGVLKYEFEDRNLYASEKVAKQQSDQHCLSLGNAEGLSGDLEKMNGQWVRISGLATSDFCPEGTLCTASCSDAGIFVKAIDSLPNKRKGRN